MIEQDNLMRTNLLVTIREIPRRRGSAIILGSILLGLVLARFMMISPLAAILVLSSGIILALTFLLRKINYLIFGWFCLTSMIWFIMRSLPTHLYPYVGRGIFWGLLICIIAAWAIDNILSARPFLPFDHVPLKATILIFLLWGVATLFTSVDVFNSVKKLSHFILALASSYMFYDFFSRDQNNIKKIIGIVIVILLLISSITVLIAGYSLMSGVVIYKQLYLWFINPNVLGYILFMCIPIFITTGHEVVSNRTLRICAVSVALLAIFFSFHRTSWLATLSSIAFILFKGRMKASMWTAAIIGIFVSALLLPVFGEDVYQFFTGERYTGRIEIWQAAWNTACDYPILGTGPGNSMEIMSRYIDTPWLMEEETHSVYLKNAAEMGFISVVIMLVIYVTFFASSERIERNLKSDYLRNVSRGVTATFLGLLIHGIFENGYFLTPFVAAEFHALLPYMFLSLPFAAKRLEERGEAD